MVAMLDSRLWFPDPNRGRRDGLVAIGGDLSVPRLVLAYRTGLFPWTVHPITWWSPDPRGIFELEKFHVSRSLAYELKRGRFRVTFDQAFSNVIRTCAEVPRDGDSTWITGEFIEAYEALHRSGYAHSVEAWSKEGTLVGGLYGVAVGGLFAGESMFHKASNASKVCLVRLVERLREHGFVLFDTQMVTSATTQMGAVEISRHEYLSRLEKAVKLESCRF
jgi:leucyl/phenylalanyl-tRNA---protein transferase